MIERYSTKASKKIWSDQNKYSTWLKVEIAVCRELERVNKIPKGVCKMFDKIPEFSQDQIQEILKIEDECKHDVIAFLTFLENFYGENAKYIHLGLTSSDIVDTSTSLLYQEMIKEILKSLTPIAKKMYSMAKDHKSTLMIGRTHGMHAQPTTFGITMAGFTKQFMRAYDELERAYEAISFGKLSGAVGTNNNITVAEEKRILQNLGLDVEPFATQVVCRDRHAMCSSALALLACAMERLCLTIRHLQREEVQELQEPFSSAQKGSSAMPHKRNPILSENICGLSRYVRSNIAPAFENISLWHERDMSHSSVERMIIPETTSIVHFMCERLLIILNGLSINSEKMMENMMKSSEKIFSESILLALIDAGVSRQAGYIMVQRCAQSKFDFVAALFNDEEVLKHISKSQIEKIVDIEKLSKKLEGKFNAQIL